jgi:hypothetical protein
MEIAERKMPESRVGWMRAGACAWRSLVAGEPYAIKHFAPVGIVSVELKLIDSR